MKSYPEEILYYRTAMQRLRIGVVAALVGATALAAGVLVARGADYEDKINEKAIPNRHHCAAPGSGGGAGADVWTTSRREFRRYASDNCPLPSPQRMVCAASLPSRKTMFTTNNEKE